MFSLKYILAGDIFRISSLFLCWRYGGEEYGSFSMIIYLPIAPYQFVSAAMSLVPLSGVNENDRNKPPRRPSSQLFGFG